MTDTTQTTIQDAISQSADTGEIVHIDAVAGICDELMSLCDDYASTQDQDGPLEEYWGMTDGGAPWRVHVHG